MTTPVTPRSSPTAEPEPEAAANAVVTPLVHTCDVLAKQTHDIVAEPFAALVGDEPPATFESSFWSGLGVCHPGPGGAWAVVALDMETTDVGDEDNPARQLDGAVMLVHVDEQGHTLESEAAFVVQLNTLADYGNDATFEILAAHDYDGDGLDEVVVQTEHSGYDLHRVVSDIRARVTEDDDVYIDSWPQLESIDYDTVIDYDGDGIYELVTNEQYWAATRCFDMAGSSAEGTPPVLFHADPDGRFTASDEVAVAFLRERCPRAPGRLLIAGTDDWEFDAMHRIACARLWGQSAAAVTARIRSEWRTLSAEETTGEHACNIPRREFEAYAQIEPPVVLTPR